MDAGRGNYAGYVRFSGSALFGMRIDQSQTRGLITSRARVDLPRGLFHFFGVIGLVGQCQKRKNHGSKRVLKIFIFEIFDF